MKTSPDVHKQPHKIRCRQRNACLHQLPKPSDRDRAFIMAYKQTQEKPPTTNTVKLTDTSRHKDTNSYLDDQLPKGGKNPTRGKP